MLAHQTSADTAAEEHASGRQAEGFGAMTRISGTATNGAEALDAVARG